MNTLFTMRMRRRTVAFLTALACSSGVMMAAPATASAAPKATVMVQTQRMDGPSLKGKQHGWYKKSSRVTLSCYKRGQSVKGYYSPWIPGGWDNLWYKVSDGKWIADVDIHTGTNNPVTKQCTTTPAPKPPASSLNARILKRTQSYKNGTYGGQCLAWVTRVIREAGGPSFGLGYNTATYQSQWSRWATSVSWANAKPGDVIQWQSGANVHTAILVSGTSPDKAQIVDSNYGWNEVIHRGSFASRANALRGVPYKIWRVKG